MSDADRLRRVDAAYDRAVFEGDAGGLAEAERGLDQVEADVAVARGRIRHARFLSVRAAGGSPAEDPDELPLFERAAELYRAAGDVRGEGGAAFWIGCFHQVVRRDDAAAVPELERAGRLAAQAGDRVTRAETLRHLGIAAHFAGRLDEARARLEESSELRRQIGAWPGVAANMVGLAYVAAAQGRQDDAEAILGEAHTLADTHRAAAIVRQVEQARTDIRTR